jgi:hypothetical protein
VSGWPDPDKPGVPLNQDVTGEHYIADSVALWFADLKKWAIIGGSKLQTPELLAGQSWAEYIGPCPTSAEADALRAENARLREALTGIAANAAVPGYAPEQRHAIWGIARAALEVKP